MTEPTTTLTDYGLALLCAWYAWRLWSVATVTGGVSVGHWAVGMACLAAASLAGGTVHGFSTVLSPSVAQRLWKGTVYAVGLATFFWFAGTLGVSVTAPVRSWLMILPSLQLVVFAWWMAHHDDFLFVIYDYGSMNVAILMLQLHGWYRSRIPSAPWLVTAVCVSGLAAAVQAGGLSLHSRFNHNDLYHVIQMGGTYLYYQGALRLTDR
jgi:hypothetical protein